MNIGRFYGVGFGEDHLGVYTVDKLKFDIDGTTDEALQARIDGRIDMLRKEAGVDALEDVLLTVEISTGRTAYVIVTAIVSDTSFKSGGRPMQAITQVDLTSDELAGFIKVYANGYRECLNYTWQRWL